jgi:AhpD family alkylhydroperoxidase
MNRPYRFLPRSHFFQAWLQKKPSPLEQILHNQWRKIINGGKEDGRKKQMNVEEILKMMEKGLGEEPKPMVLMSKLIPEWIPRQAQERKFVMEDLKHIPPKYKHLIMIGASAAVGCHLCTGTFIKIAPRAGVTKEEIAEAILAPRFALASTTFATAVEGMEYLAAK